jgi:hypothetical protein
MKRLLLLQFSETKRLVKYVFPHAVAERGSFAINIETRQALRSKRFGTGLYSADRSRALRIKQLFIIFHEVLHLVNDPSQSGKIYSYYFSFGSDPCLTVFNHIYHIFIKAACGEA